MKKTSCGVIIANPATHEILAVRPWGRPKALDIPKGIREIGEYSPACALRELREETGIVLRSSQLEDLGVFKYLPDKDLQLYLHKVTSFPDTTKLACSSMMVNPMTQKDTVPEVTGFEVTHFQDSRFYKSLKPILACLDELICN